MFSVTDPWNLSQAQHRQRAEKNRIEVGRLEKKLGASGQRARDTNIIRIYSMQARIHDGFAVLPTVQGNTKRANKNREIQKYFKDLGDLYDKGIALTKDPAERQMLLNMKREAYSVAGGASSELSDRNIFGGKRFPSGRTSSMPSRLHSPKEPIPKRASSAGIVDSRKRQPRSVSAPPRLSDRARH